MADLERTIRDNVAEVRQRIAEAAARGGRSADSVTLVAVTKYVDSEIAALLPAAGCNQLGESRPQHLWDKAKSLEDLAIYWHLIGHLQSNKAKRSVPLLYCIHSGDRLSILNTLNRLAEQTADRIKVLLEINISGDVEKHGFSPDEAIDLAPRLGEWEHLEIGGLMAMSARASDAKSARCDYVRLRQLRDRMQANCPSCVELKQLSMGMSRDFEVAVEEGATMVRVGSALFAGVSY